MRRTILVGMWFPLVGVWALVVSSVAAQDQVAAEEAAAWAKAATPGPQHRCFEMFAGKWTVAGSYWPAPGAQPQPITGEMEGKRVLGDRFVLATGTLGGGAIHFIELMGYDNVRQQYVTVSASTMATAIHQAVGTCDGSGKNFTFTSEYDDPVTGKTKKTRQTIRIVSDDEHVGETYLEGPDGNEFKAMAMTYARAKPETSPAPKKDPTKIQGKWVEHYYKRVEQFERENAAARNIVLVGSSHIEGFGAAKWLPGRRVVNRGIGSDRIGIGDRGILRRLDNTVFDCNPGIVILENGANDLGELWRHGTPSIDETDACYRKVVKAIRTRRPDVALVIVGLFPTRDRYAGLVPLIVEFNERLKKIAADFDCPFMEVYEPFADSEGLLRKDFSRDGLHLNEAGYALWAQMVRDVLPPDIGVQDAPPRPSSEKE